MRLVAANVRRSLILLLSTGSPAEPLDSTGGTLRFRGTPVEKHYHRWSQGSIWLAGNEHLAVTGCCSMVIR